MPILRLPMSFDQQWSKQDISHLFFLCFLSHKELENVLESSRERERERERAGESDLESSRKRKRREDRDRNGYTFVVEKKQEEKKNKKEKKFMDEIKKGKII